MQLTDNLHKFKKKLFLNQLIRGGILFVGVSLCAYLVATTAEFVGYLPVPVKALLVAGVLGIEVVLAFLWVALPLRRYLQASQVLSDEEAARQISTLFPDISDKLLNTLQLSRAPSESDALLAASLAQRTSELSVFDFSTSIRLEQNTRWAKWASIPLAVLILLAALAPKLFTEGTFRLIHITTQFQPPPPFTFALQNQDLKVYKNESINIQVKLEGEYLPSEVFLTTDTRSYKMAALDGNMYQLLLEGAEVDLPFVFEASGYKSNPHLLKVVSRPLLLGFDVQLHYPEYIKKKNEQISNAGNLIVPEGTWVTWSFHTEDCDRMMLKFGTERETLEVNKALFGGFTYKRQIRKSQSYAISLANVDGTNKDTISYSIQSIEDQYPTLSMMEYKDTVLYTHIVVAGTLSDDYGFQSLLLHYRTDKDKVYKTIPLPFTKNVLSQSFYTRWAIDTLGIAQGKDLEYFVSVSDNDGVNGPKSTKSAVYSWKMPTDEMASKSINQSTESAEKQLNNSLNKAEALRKEAEKLEKKLRSKKNLDWQDKKAIEDMLKKNQQLSEEIQELQLKHQELLDKKDRFDKQNERIAEKSKLLQQLMNEILDEETKKMYNELAKLLQEKNKDNEIKELVEKLKNKEQNVEKELDRALEMFKQLKFESKLESITEKLDQLAQKQEELSDKSLQKGTDSEQLQKEQQEINSKFEEVKQEMKELTEINQELENKNDLENTEDEQSQIEQDQQKSTESLGRNDKKEASKAQKDASKKLAKLKEKMDKMLQSMEMQGLDENMADLRQILDNLLHLSHEQEEVMKQFKSVTQQDPRYISLSQRQLKLKDDSKVVEDSLYALSKRVFQIQSFITKELEDMKRYMDESSKSIKARRADQAAGKQQYAMTSMNNLALLLSDVLQQMQEQKNDMKQKGSGTMKGDKKKQCNSGKPSLSQMQKKLNKQIEELKKSGMSGRKLSEELAKMARQQEQIRNAMEQEGSSGQPKNGKGEDGKEAGDGKSELEKLKKEMEETEGDLVNKRLTQELLQRQEEILNRLLEHEKAQREREEDQQRQAKTAEEKSNKMPPGLEQFLKEKQKQVELIRSIPPGLNPYYKKEADEYFQKISQ